MLVLQSAISVLLLWIWGGELPPFPPGSVFPCTQDAPIQEHLKPGLVVVFHLLAVLLIGCLKEQHLAGRGTSDVCATLQFCVL